jgi:hypothetical protein
MASDAPGFFDHGHRMGEWAFSPNRTGRRCEQLEPGRASLLAPDGTSGASLRVRVADEGKSKRSVWCKLIGNSVDATIRQLLIELGYKKYKKKDAG